MIKSMTFTGLPTRRTALVLAFAAASAESRDDSGLESRACPMKDLSFDALPGKGALFKPGFRFVQGDHPELAKFEVVEDDYQVLPSIVGIDITRVVVFERPDQHDGVRDRLWVEIQTHPISTDNAQEAVITMLTQASYANLSGPTQVRGDLENIRVRALRECQLVRRG